MCVTEGYVEYPHFLVLIVEGVLACSSSIHEDREVRWKVGGPQVLIVVPICRSKSRKPRRCSDWSSDNHGFYFDQKHTRVLPRTCATDWPVQKASSILFSLLAYAPKVIAGYVWYDPRPPERVRPGESCPKLRPFCMSEVRVDLALPNRSAPAASQLTRDSGSTIDMVEGCTRTKLSRAYRAACQLRYGYLLCDNTGIIISDADLNIWSRSVRRQKGSVCHCFDRGTGSKQGGGVQDTTIKPTKCGDSHHDHERCSTNVRVALAPEP
jgi:hypothetical protein